MIDDRTEINTIYIRLQRLIMDKCDRMARDIQ